MVFRPASAAIPYWSKFQQESWQAPLQAFYANTHRSDVSTGVLDGSILVPTPTAERVSTYVAARRGHPAPTAGEFGRFLYFSVVTITTLGYGDIVPLTDRARLVVGIESIFGVVVAGLFINATSRRRRGA